MKHTYTFLFLFFLQLLVVAQGQRTFQWVQRWGGAFQFREHIFDMEVDKEGNIYVTSDISPFQVIGDTVLGGYDDLDNLLISFDCQGNIRWFQVTGSPNKEDGGYIEIIGDHIYYTSYVDAIYSKSYHFFDSTFTNTPQRAFLSKISLDGELKDFKWLAGGGQQTSWPTEMGKRGDSLYVGFGSFAGTVQGFSLPAGYHIGVFDTSFTMHRAFTYGNPVPNQKLEGIEIDDQGNIYLGGHHHYGQLSSIVSTIGGTEVDESMFLAKFNPQGQMQWLHKQTNVTRPYTTIHDIQLNGNYLHFGGWVANTPKRSGLTPAVVFGDTMWAQGTGGSQNYFGKVDLDGNLQFHKTVLSASQITGGEGMLVVNDTMYSAGFTSGHSDLGFTRPETVSGENVLYAAFYDETTGTGGHIAMYEDYGGEIQKMVSDGNGNIYMAGRFVVWLTAGNDTVWQDGGGFNDLFLVKYGVALCVDSTPTGIAQVQPELGSWQLWPQPVSTTAQLSLSLPAGYSGEALQFEMYDIQGKAVPLTPPIWHQQGTSATTTLHRGTLPSGLYLWRVTGGGQLLGSGKVAIR